LKFAAIFGGLIVQSLLRGALVLPKVPEEPERKGGHMRNLGVVTLGLLAASLATGCAGPQNKFMYHSDFERVSVQSTPLVGVESTARVGNEIYLEHAAPIVKLAILDAPLAIAAPQVSSWPAEAEFERTALAAERAYCVTVKKDQATAEKAAGFHCFLDADRDGTLEVFKYRPLGKEMQWVENRDFPPVAYHSKFRPAASRVMQASRVIELVEITETTLHLVLRARQTSSPQPYYLFNNSYEVTLSKGKGELLALGLLIEFTVGPEDQITYTVKKPFDDWASISGGGRSFSYSHPRIEN
jgi:hypothetical protein